jgi:AbrB family looped-hinge helix DNA binding protein
MRTTVSTKGQIVLPAEFRKLDAIDAGQELEVERIEAGEYRLTLRTRKGNAGLVKLLLSCPVKGWFEPQPRHESTAGRKVVRVG